mmetsp:Transcript_46134/g.128321  ORF Transcript_46134/g.128321 Transcript_46134/m.128321 type:complete len:255 (+) Transcript_46134:103-867(+)
MSTRTKRLRKARNSVHNANCSDTGQVLSSAECTAKMGTLRSFSASCCVRSWRWCAETAAIAAKTSGIREAISQVPMPPMELPDRYTREASTQLARRSSWTSSSTQGEGVCFQVHSHFGEQMMNCDAANTMPGVCIAFLELLRNDTQPVPCMYTNNGNDIAFARPRSTTRGRCMLTTWFPPFSSTKTHSCSQRQCNDPPRVKSSPNKRLTGRTFVIFTLFVPTSSRFTDKRWSLSRQPSTTVPRQPFISARSTNP